SWICESKDQGSYSPATITASVVGISPLNPPQSAAGPAVPIVRIVKNTSAVAAHPVATAGKVADEFAITGCGGKAEPLQALVFDPTTNDATPPGQLLTEVFPVTPTGAQNVPATGCEAPSKDHFAAADGTVTAYAINVLFEPPGFKSYNPHDGRVGTPITLLGDHFPNGMKLRFFGAVDVPVNSGYSVSSATAFVPGLPPGPYRLKLVFGDWESDW